MSTQYNLIINIELNKSCKNYSYYFNNSNHVIYFDKKGINIFFSSRQELSSIEEMLKYNNQRILKAIQKSLLVYIILYNKTLEIDKIQLIKNEEIIDTQDNQIYSLTSNKFSYDLPSNFNNDYLIQKILDNKQSDCNKLIPAIHSYIYSFNKKDNETEKFIYLWMTINSIYNFLQEIVKDKGKNPQDTYGLSLLACLLENKIINKNYNNNANYNLAIKYIEENSSKNFILDFNKCKELKKEIKDISIDTYTNVYFSYKVRCNLFHANKELLLFSSKEDYELKILEQVNDNLISIINDILPKVFNDTWINKKIKLLRKQYEIIIKI